MGIQTLNIENKDRDEAQFMSRNCADAGLKNRIYINALGAEVVLRFLASNGIETSNLHNMHSVSRIIEATDISDILLPNIHIDVRVVFDESQIFVPIEHSELGITPDIYVVLKLVDDNFTQMDLLGYFNPSKINRNHKNSQYYFVNKEDLSDAESLPEFVKNFSGNTSRGISEDKLLRGRTLSISLADNNISFEERKELFNLLLSSDELRESVLEFDNFETLSYNAAPLLEQLPKDEPAEIDTSAVLKEEDASTETSSQNDEPAESEEDENMPDNEAEEKENTESDSKKEADEEKTEDNTSDETAAGIDDANSVTANNDANILVSGEDSEALADPLSPDLDIAIDNISDGLDLDLDLDNTGDLSEKGKDNIVDTAINAATDAAIVAGAAGAAAAASTAAATAGETLTAGAAVSQGAMDLAALAGELVQKLPDPASSKQEDENLLDFSQVSPAARSDSAPELPSPNENSQDVKDFSDFDTVEDFSSATPEIEPETTDFSDMKTAETIELPENTETSSDSLTDISDVTQNDESEKLDFLQELAPETEGASHEDLTSSDIEINEPEESSEVSSGKENISEKVVQSKNEEDDAFSEDDFKILEDDSTTLSKDDDNQQKSETQETVNDNENSEENNWTSDVNYDNLEDVTPEEPEINEAPQENQTEISDGEEVKAIVNSTPISDKNYTAGEIEIDINKPKEQFRDGSEHLENLYKDEENIPGGSLLNGPGLLSRPQKGVGLGILGIVVTLIIVGVMGVFISKIAHKPTEDEPQPVTDNNMPSDTPQQADETDLNVDEGNVVKMDNVSPISPAATVQSKPGNNTVQTKHASAGPLSATQFIEVSKLSWEAPDYVAASPAFRQYFQSAGKSLKLSLTSDLLLANDYIYSDQVRVSVNFSQDGTFKNARMLLSSGSQQVDKIVLQTVNQTLKVLKAPHSVGNNSDTTVILKIYF